MEKQNGEKAKKSELYQPTRRFLGTVNLDSGWKVFYSGTDLSMSSQVGVWICRSPRLSDCAPDLIFFTSRVSMLLNQLWINRNANCRHIPDILLVNIRLGGLNK